jgi:hypothetical protein
MDQHAANGKLIPALSAMTALLIVVAAVCAADVINPQPPTRSDDAPLLPAPSVSMISLPVRIETAALERAMLALIPDHYHEKKSVHLTGLLDDEWIEPDIHFENMRLQGRGNELLLSSDLSGSIRTGGRVLWKSSTATLRKIRGRLRVGISLNIEPSWTLTATVAASSEISNAKIKLLGVTVSVSSIAEDELNKYLRRKLPDLVNEYLQEIDLKQEAERLWERANQVTELTHGLDHALWLRTTPQSISFKPLDFGDGEWRAHSRFPGHAAGRIE